MNRTAGDVNSCDRRESGLKKSRISLVNITDIMIDTETDILNILYMHFRLSWTPVCGLKKVDQWILLMYAFLPILIIF